MVYQGQTGNVLNYLNNIGYPAPKYCNPFDFCLTVLQDNNNNSLTRKSNINEIGDLNNYFYTNYEKEIKSKFNQELEDYTGKYYDKNTELNDINILIDEKKKEYNISWFMEFYLLLLRALKDYFRNKELFFTRLIQYFSTSLLFMGFYYGIGNSENNLGLNVLGVCFNTTNGFFINVMFSSLFF